jgi:DNA-binding response OmpR family regulator
MSTNAFKAPIPMLKSEESGHPESSTARPRRKILIVDDNRVILKVLKGKLEADGFDVLTAEDGSTAVSIVRREKPDLILLDVCFPPDVAHGGGVPWDGFLIMNWLRRMEEATDTPIIIISGKDPSEYGQKFSEAGVTDFFQKPLDPEELLATIHRVLDGDPPAQ